jgi:hypothetical protein
VPEENHQQALMCIKYNAGKGRLCLPFALLIDVISCFWKCKTGSGLNIKVNSYPWKEVLQYVTF